MELLPLDILAKVLKRVHLVDLINFHQTSKYYYSQVKPKIPAWQYSYGQLYVKKYEYKASASDNLYNFGSYKVFFEHEFSNNLTVVLAVSNNYKLLVFQTHNKRYIESHTFYSISNLFHVSRIINESLYSDEDAAASSKRVVPISDVYKPAFVNYKLALKTALIGKTSPSDHLIRKQFTYKGITYILPVTPGQKYIKLDPYHRILVTDTCYIEVAYQAAIMGKQVYINFDLTPSVQYYDTEMARSWAIINDNTNIHLCNYDQYYDLVILSDGSFFDLYTNIPSNPDIVSEFSTNSNYIHVGGIWMHNSKIVLETAIATTVNIRNIYYMVIAHKDVLSVNKIADLLAICRNDGIYDVGYEFVQYALKNDLISERVIDESYIITFFRNGQAAAEKLVLSYLDRFKPTKSLWDRNSSHYSPEFRAVLEKKY